MTTQCPENEKIVDYISGILSKKEKTLFQNHMASCDDCRNEFVLTNQVLQDCEQDNLNIKTITSVKLSESVSKLKNVIQKANDTIVDWLTPAPALQPVPIDNRKYELKGRGKEGDSEDEMNSLAKTIKNLTIHVVLINPKESTSDIKVMIYESQQKASQLTIFVIDEKGKKHAKILDGGAVLFENMLYGSYQIKINQFEDAIGEFAFDLQQMGIYENEHHSS